MADEPPRKWGPWRWIAAGAGLVLIVGLAAAWLALRPYGETGTTYLAKQLCSCLYLTGRSEASCRSDFSPDIERFSVGIDRKRSRVSARLALFSSAAVYEPGYGCRIER
jgi:hypothetical protein